MDTHQDRHVVLEGTPSDLVTPPVLPVQMPATQTLPTASRDRAAVVPPIVTPVTIVGDPRSHMDRLEQRIRRMRDLDEMILWDDPGDVPVATLPIGFRMPDIERYTGVGCPRIHLRLYSTVMRALGLDEAQLLTLFPLSLSGVTQRWYASLETSRRKTWEDLAQEFLRQYSFSGDTSVTRRELEFLRQGSDEPISSFISRWREKAAEMIERPTERDQMSMFLRSLHPRFARHLTGVPFQDFRSLVQALLDVDDGISRGLWSDIIHSPDTEGKGVVGSSESYGGICSAIFSIDDLLSSTLLYIRILSRCDLHFSFSVHRLVSHDMSSLVPIDDVRGLILIWGCLWIELLSDSVLDSFSVVTGPRAEIDGMMGMIFSEYIEIRLLQLRFTMSDEIAPITLTTLYEMMVDLTRRVERIELILSEHPSSSRGAPGVAMPSLPHLTSPTPVTLGASHPRPRPHLVLQQHSSSISLATLARPPSQLRGPSVVTVPHERFHPHRRCRRHFSDLSAPQLRGPSVVTVPHERFTPIDDSVGHHTDRCTALRHAIQDIVDSGTFGDPQSDMFPIPTSAQAMHADAPSPAVPDLIDLGDWLMIGLPWYGGAQILFPLWPEM
uniref:Retrotransposon gag domain-containing protein n=1 Tax=Vitis vinifera TaxID=29760 RepID=A5AVS2_VITVI|nr:hypothetical protein VITISV_013886 [Vitis vinifera]